MTIDDKKAIILDFYKTAGLALKEIETGLNDWLTGNSTKEFDKTLLNVAQLAIQILQMGRNM